MTTYIDGDELRRVLAGIAVVTTAYDGADCILRESVLDLVDRRCAEARDETAPARRGETPPLSPQQEKGGGSKGVAAGTFHACGKVSNGIACMQPVGSRCADCSYGVLGTSNDQGENHG